MHSTKDTCNQMAAVAQCDGDDTYDGRTQSVHGQWPETAHYALYRRHLSFSYPPPVKGVSPIFLPAAQYNVDNFHLLSLLPTLCTASVRRTS